MCFTSHYCSWYVLKRHVDLCNPADILLLFCDISHSPTNYRIHFGKKSNRLLGQNINRCVRIQQPIICQMAHFMAADMLRKDIVESFIRAPVHDIILFSVNFFFEGMNIYLLDENKGLFWTHEYICLMKIRVSLVQQVNRYCGNTYMSYVKCGAAYKSSVTMRFFDNKMSIKAT